MWLCYVDLFHELSWDVTLPLFVLTLPMSTGWSNFGRVTLKKNGTSSNVESVGRGSAVNGAKTKPFRNLTGWTIARGSSCEKCTLLTSSREVFIMNEKLVYSLEQKAFVCIVKGSSLQCVGMFVRAWLRREEACWSSGAQCDVLWNKHSILIILVNSIHWIQYLFVSQQYNDYIALIPLKRGVYVLIVR